VTPDYPKPPVLPGGGWKYETSNLVDRLIVASAGPWMANHSWKGRGQVTWTI